MPSVKSKIHGVKVDKVVDPSAHFDFPLLNDLKYTNNLVQKYLGKKDFITKYLGKGTFGYAYLTKAGTVFKFTKTDKEAASSLILSMFGDKLKTQAKIYRIYEIVIGEQRLFIIEKEYIQPVREYIETELHINGFDSFQPAAVLEQLLESEYETYESFKKDAINIASNRYDQAGDAIRSLFKNKKLMKSVFDFHRTLTKNEYETGMPLSDTHIGNMGIKNDRVVCFDCVTSSKYILNHGGMIKKQIKDSTIKSKISKPQIGKLGWDKVSPVIWKTVIRDNRHAYINDQGSNFDLFIYDYNASKNEPIDGGSFESFNEAEDWLINNYAREELKEIFKTQDELKQFFQSEGYRFTHYENERTHEEDGKLYYNPEDLAEQNGFKKHFADGGKGRFDGWIYTKGSNDWIDYMILKNKFADGGAVGESYIGKEISLTFSYGKFPHEKETATVKIEKETDKAVYVTREQLPNVMRDLRIRKWIPKKWLKETPAGLKATIPMWAAENGDKIPGGLAEGKTLQDIADHHKVSMNELEQQLLMGIDVELEHTTSREVAREIAMDHLWENPKYYTLLEKVKLQDGGKLSDLKKMSVDDRMKFDYSTLDTKTLDEFHDWLIDNPTPVPRSIQEELNRRKKPKRLSEREYQIAAQTGKHKMQDGGDTKDKRYAVTTDMYEYAKDDESVIKKAQEFVGDLRKKLDNQAQIVDITETPFASMKSRTLKNVPKYAAGGKIADIEYTRVIPRDLFNEGKLLKCIGRLILLIHDNNVPVPMSFHHDDEPFNIGLMEEGSLTITNINIWIKKKQFIFKTTYNSKSNYPLFVQDNNYADYRVFNENGEFDNEFIEFCKTVPKYSDGGKTEKYEWENLPDVDLGVDISKDWMKLWEKFLRENKLKLELPHKDPKDRGEQSDNAYFMLRHIVSVKRKGWIPDWNNSREYKYYPWFYMDSKNGFAFYVTSHAYSGTDVGSRLCFPSAELCEAVAREFLAIYRIYFTEK